MSEVRNIEQWWNYPFFLSLILIPTHCKCRGLLLHLITFNDTQINTNTIGRPPLDKGSVRRRDFYLHNIKQTQETDIHASGRIRDSNPSK